MESGYKYIQVLLLPNQIWCATLLKFALQQIKVKYFEQLSAHFFPEVVSDKFSIMIEPTFLYPMQLNLELR